MKCGEIIDLLKNFKFSSAGSPRRHPYFDVVVGLARSYEPESYAGGSLATGRVVHARQVEGYGPDKKGHPGPPSWRSVTGRNSQARQSYPKE